MKNTPTPHDDVAAQLRDLERQGGGMAQLAHWSAALLLLAFSAGSLISISHAAFMTFLAQWSTGRVDIPDGISLVVNLLLVISADVALLYAASVLRVLIAAQAPASEQRVHRLAMIGASVLESSTYLYLAWSFDRPTTLFLWALMVARAACAPLFAAYLSMARPLPVGPRDVAYQASLHSGKGVVRDVAALAADRDAPLERKVRIYRAAALMSPHDRTRFDEIIASVAEEPTPQAAPQAALLTPAPASGQFVAAYSERSINGPETEPEPPTPGPGQPRGRSERSATTRRRREPVLMLASDRPRRVDAGRRSEEAQQRWLLHTDQAADLLTTEPRMSTRELARRLGVSVQRATEVRRSVQPVRPSRAEVEADKQATQPDGKVSA